MNRKAVIGMVALAGLILGAAPTIFLLNGGRSIKFQDAALNANAQSLAVLANRHTMNINTTSQAGLLGNVGLVLIVDRTTASTQPIIFDRSNTNGEFRPSPDLLLVQSLNNILYEGKVSKNLSESGTFTSFAAELSVNQAADVVVKDEIYFGYKDRTQIPYKALRKYRIDPRKSYFFVESATLTSITHKVYDEAKMDAALNGTAFGANGKVYVSNSGYIYDAKLGVDLLDLSLLQPEEGGNNPEITRLLRKDTLSVSESERLLSYLKEGSKEQAHKSLSAVRFNFSQ